MADLPYNGDDPASSNEASFRVAIIGGGMCGLLLAIALHRSGIDVEVFESAVSHLIHGRRRKTLTTQQRANLAR